jgi:two-component system sensor histidine kinase BarA
MNITLIARHLTLRARLALLLLLCAGTTALFGLASVLCAGIWLEPARAREEAAEFVATLAATLEVPLAFEDDKAVAETLGMLRARSDIRSAEVYDLRGRRVAFLESASAVTFPNWLPFGGELVVDKPIGTATQPLGRVVIRQQLERMQRTLALEFGAIIVGMLLGLSASLVVARRVARRITDPVAELAHASTAIAQEKDYSRRLNGGGDDEIGRAVKAFNRMLEELQARDAALESSMQTLEARVIERTQELRREKERAESASRAKTSFLANMSHELRTPLNAVIGAAQLLQQPAGGLDQAQLIDIVRHSGTNLLGLIENVLDVSRIEAGELPALRDDFNLADCLEAALTTAAVAARAKGVTACGIIDADLPTWCNGDAIRLRQVVLNLLGNAVKFTPRGEVVLHATRGAAPGAVRIAVRDTGVGIEPDKLSDIFEPFRQADEATTRRFGGTGLGLAISRRLVRAMGGDISVRSQLAHGSEFVFEVVLAPPVTEIVAAEPLMHDVLYHEPHPASAAALAALLERCGCRGTRVESPSDLQDWSEEKKAADPGRALPWLLVSDESPRAGELLGLAQAWTEAGRLVLMVAAQRSAASPTKRHGPTPDLLKPVLRGALVSRLGSRPSSVLPADQVKVSGRPEAHGLVLVVEDDLTNQLIVGSMLRAAGHRVDVASDGSHALTLLRQHAYDVVLMDWQMPDMDGLAVTRLIRAGAVGAYGEQVPIVALTANAFAEDRTACLAAGMNDFLTKPVVSSDLLNVVGRWIHGPQDTLAVPGQTSAGVR